MAPQLRVRACTAVVALMMVLGVLAGCSSAPEGGSSEPAGQDAGTVVADTELTGLDPAVVDATSWTRLITYRSRSGIDDGNTQVTGSVFVPKGDPPEGGFRIVVVAPNVVGTAPDCAASRSPDLLGNTTAVKTLLQARNIVFVPDYQGLGASPDGSTTYHPYADSTTAGYVIIDGVRAVRELVSVPTSTSWAALGSFEGGQAVWAANELVDNYGSGLDLVATASLSPLADFQGLADAAAAGTLTPEQKLVYIAYLAAVHAEHEYDVDLDDYRRGAAQDNWDALLSCQAGTDRLALAGQIPPPDLMPSGPEALSALRGYLQKTTLPQGPTSAPMYVIYGGRDAVLPAAWTEVALGRACRMGDVIQIAFWPDEGHPSIDPVAAAGWLIERLELNPSANDCESFLAGRDLPGLDAGQQNRAPREAADRSVDSDSGDSAPAPPSSGVSLTGGWLPFLVQVVTIAALVFAVGRRSRFWNVHWIPASLMIGFALAAMTRLFVQFEGWTDRAASWQTVFWVAATGFALGVAVFGWQHRPWWQRSVSVSAVLLCTVTALFALNTATGYFPTVASLWRQVSGAQPDDWVDESVVAQMVRDGDRPAEGTVAWIEIPNDASGFDHRDELIYLPPAWFTADPPPALPVVVMLGGEFSQPSDWPVSARAVQTLDRFAAAHDGYAPVVVFPDTTGSFSNDTECVNGPRGQAADHLMNDVVPYVKATFGVSADAAQWGLVGWSSGGTCALTTAVRHPETFSAFVDLDGQLGPNMGTKRQTVARLFGGDEQAWADFDPRTVIERRGRFPGMAAWLGVSEKMPTEYRPAGDTAPNPDAIGDWVPYSEEHADNARKLCLLLSGHGVECSVVGYGGAHDFDSAAEAFRTALPWLAGRLGTPQVPARGLPGSP
ncbi:alpha/beta hydrolase-fold protein [Mycobacterium sp. AMU20-3851]|uniref:alpha/beta hydrolase-fold protein n=1 Tax=Mycobacterium sp. AMU20-3851 TaxID=3122055 RepID=UPI003754B05A